MANPIRGRRILVEIPEILDNTQPTGNPIIVKMKKGIAEYWGLQQIPTDDPRLRGVFAGAGTNAGATFQRRRGGFRFRSFTFLPVTQYSITEYYYDAQGNPISAPGNFNSMSIGFPKGVTVNEVVDWVLANAKVAETEFVVSPSDVRTAIYKNPV